MSDSHASSSTSEGGLKAHPILGASTESQSSGLLDTVEQYAITATPRGRDSGEERSYVALECTPPHSTKRKSGGVDELELSASRSAKRAYVQQSASHRRSVTPGLSSAVSQKTVPSGIKRHFFSHYLSHPPFLLPLSIHQLPRNSLVCSRVLWFLGARRSGNACERW